MECWEFTGALNANGYGCCHPSYGSTLVHRAVFLAIYGYLPPVVRHKCDNRKCYNPAHLLPGTQADNIRDAIERGRPNPRNGRQFNTSCVNGHEFTITNTGKARDGARICRTCRRADQRRYQERLRSQLSL